ncbi:MAG: PD-(D/E)XK nuclease family protein [Candidatus Omnitrophica bacterium]|nr:PD-(D/E)XK nuclease family protein [Candidatus Omnitrophota bacterium]
MAVYSHSRLSTFETCPLQFKYNYIDKIEREEQGIEAFMGTQFHNVMEKLYEDLKFKTYKLEELLKMYDMNWDKEFTESIIIVRKDRTAEDYKNAGKKCIEDYYKRYYPFDQGRVVGIERAVSVDLNNDGRYKIRGFIDRLVQADDGTYEIHDYKTSGHLPEQEQFDKDRQLALYQIGISDMWNDVSEVKLIWHYVIFDKEMVSIRSQEQLDDLRKSTIELIDKIESAEEFLPQESTLCIWCSYQDVCPKKKHIYKVSDLPPNEYLEDSGVKLVEQYMDLEDKKEELKQEVSIIGKEQDKIKEAAIKFAEKEEVSVIDGPGKRLKIDIKKDIKTPSKGNNPKEWAGLRDILIKEWKYEEVSTVNSSMLKAQIRKNLWPQNFINKLKPFVKEQIVKRVTLVKKREDV